MKTYFLVLSVCLNVFLAAMFWQERLENQRLWDGIFELNSKLTLERIASNKLEREIVRLMKRGYR